MERRLLTIFLASTIFITIYLGLNVFLPPPAKPLAENAADVQQADQNFGDDVVPELNQGEPLSNVTDGDAENNVSAVDEEAALLQTSGGQWTTLGSMAPESGYNMLVTLRSQGGAIDRIELTERKENGRLKYRRVDVRSGYLGYLALASTITGDGAVIRIVGPGTPAAIAKPVAAGPLGLAVGDKIIAIGNQAIAGPSDMGAILEKTNPGDIIAIEVERAGTALQFDALLTEHPLDLVRLADTAGDDQVAGNLTRPSCLLTLSQLSNRTIRTGQREMVGIPSQHRAVWATNQSEVSEQPNNEVAFKLVLPANLVQKAGGDGEVVLARSFRLDKGSYHLDMNMKVTNNANTSQKLAYRLEGPNGLTLEGWWYSTKISPNFSGAGARDFVYNTAAEHHELISAYNLLKKVTATPQDPNTVIFTADAPEAAKQLRYISVDTQYFSTSYIPQDDQLYLDQFSRAAGTLVAAAAKIPANQERAANASFFVDSNIISLEPGQSIDDNIRLFAGPKQPELLEKYRLTETLEYGWFGAVAKPLSWLLHLFYAIAGNYVAAIIMLTLLVRGCMFPLSRKAAVHAQKMQELAPELKKIADKHKDDFEKRMKAQRELQQRVGFNPLSGCLPMLVQLPIFIGLYRALSVDIELRQAALSPSLQWCSNLAGPDMLYYWGDWMWDYMGGRGTGWLGPYFNILPIIVVLLFLLQQKMFMPPATDEQTAMTQKVMTVMTLMMGLFFFRVPSGLCIYFITSSLWGICERKLVKKMIPPGPKLSLEGAGVIDGTVVKSQTVSGKPSLTERLLTAAGRPPEPTTPTLPPNRRKRPPTKKK